MQARRRLEGLEARIGAGASPVGQLTPEAERERTRQFRKLYRELGIPWSPGPRDPAQVRSELMDMIASHRAHNNTKE